MARELLWLECAMFTAWGCSDCGWVLPNAGKTRPPEPPTGVQTSFDAHSCTETPQRR